MKTSKRKKSIHTSSFLADQKNRQARTKAALAEIERMCAAGLTTKSEAGRYVIGVAQETCRNLGSSTIHNFINGRVPREESLVRLEQFVVEKRKALKKLLA